MMKKTLLALVAGSLFGAALPAAWATNEPASECKSDEVSITFLDHQKCYGEGDKAPDVNSRDEVAVKNWKQLNLPAPQENAQWVKSGNHYLEINRENATILQLRDSHGKPLPKS